MIVIVDYGMGNLRSVQKAFEKIGTKALISSDPEIVMRGEKIVLPGVGAFQACMENLAQFNLIDPIREVIRQKKPFLGICMGLQVLFEESSEFGNCAGLGIIKGNVAGFKVSKKFKVPHMGWNRVRK